MDAGFTHLGGVIHLLVLALLLLGNVASGGARGIDRVGLTRGPVGATQKERSEEENRKGKKNKPLVRIHLFTRQQATHLTGST